MSITMGEGKNPTLSNALKLANVCDIQPQKALDIINHITAVVNRWKDFAQMAGVSKLSEKMIAHALNNIKSTF